MRKTIPSRLGILANLLPKNWDLECRIAEEKAIRIGRRYPRLRPEEAGPRHREEHLRRQSRRQERMEGRVLLPEERPESSRQPKENRELIRARASDLLKKQKEPMGSAP